MGELQPRRAGDGTGRCALVDPDRADHARRRIRDRTIGHEISASNMTIAPASPP